MGSNGATDFVLTTNWVRYTAVVTSYSDANTSSEHSSYYLGVPVGNTGNVYIALPKLEKGNLSTDWCPNPADNATVTALSQLSQTVDGFSGTFAKKSDLESTNSNLKVASDGLSFVTAVTGTKGENVTQVIADVNNIKTTMTGENGYTTRLQTLEGFQTTASGQIAGKAEQTQVTQLADQFTVVSGSISNPNLVLNSGLPTDKSSWLVAGDLSIGKHAFYRNNRANLFVINNATTAENMAGTNRFKVTPGQSYTVSFKAFASYNSIHQDVWFLGRSASSTASSGYDKAINLVGIHRYSASGIESAKVTFTVPDDIDEGYLRFDNNGSTDGNNSVFYFTEIKCELGSLATPWEGESSYSQLLMLQDQLDLRVTVSNKIAAALSLSADGGGTVTIRGASLYVTADSHFDNASIQSAAIASLDATKITSGSISADRLATTKLNADNITSGSISSDRLATTKLNADNITSGSISAERIASTAINADNITSGSINADLITSGSIATERLATTKLNADNITSGSISAERLATTALNADNITSGSIAADLIATTALSATNITSGTLDVGKLTVKNLSADMIASGTIDASKITVKNLSASNIIGGTLDASTMTVKNIDAAAITTGTLNAANLNVVGLNASAITTGTISGANLAINLNSGEVTFTKGSIKSIDGHLNIDVNNGTFAQSDGTKGMLFAKGNLYLSSASWWEGLSNPDAAPKPDYGFIGYTDTLLTARGFGVIGRDALTLGLTDNGNPGMEYTSSPVITMGRSNVTLDFAGELATIQAGQGFTIKTSSIYNLGQTPGIQIGSNVDRSGIGDRVFIDGSYVYVPSAYSRTSSGSANLIVASDGALVRTSSATKYKSNIERFRNADMGEALLNLPQAHWYNKQDMQRYTDDPHHYSMPELDYGMIAEDLAAAGLEDLVVRGDDGQLEDIRYDRMTPALLPLLAQMKQEIEELKSAAKSA